MSGYIAHVFGKHGCAKCDMLKKRLSALIATDKYSDFTMQYHDILTDEGIVDFCKALCINPNRIPALLIGYPEGGFIERLEEPANMYDASCIYSYVGIQTDYDKGGGLITPAMIQAVLDEALAQ